MTFISVVNGGYWAVVRHLNKIRKYRALKLE
jgi:hypothetical protein